MPNRYKFTENPHCHWLDDKPLLGTTTVLGVISKELTWWASGKCAEQFGWINQKHHTKEEVIDAAGKGWEKVVHIGDYEQYSKLLNTAYRAHHDLKEKRATEGTDLHSHVEEFIRLRMNGVEPLIGWDFGNNVMKSFIDWCEKNVKRFLFSEIHCYSEKLWVGGKTDFAYESMDGDYVLADIKSRDKDYFSDHVQCGGYDIQIQENGGLDKDGNKVWEQRYKTEGLDNFRKHAIFTLGENFKEPVFSDPDTNRKAFEFALGLCKIKKEFEDK